MAYMYHNFFNHSSVDGHLSYLYILTVVNSGTVNTGACVILNYGFLKVYVHNRMAGSNNFIPSSSSSLQHYS